MKSHKKKAACFFPVFGLYNIYRTWPFFQLWPEEIFRSITVKFIHVFMRSDQPSEYNGYVNVAELLHCLSASSSAVHQNTSAVSPMAARGRTGRQYWWNSVTIAPYYHFVVYKKATKEDLYFLNPEEQKDKPLFVYGFVCLYYPIIYCVLHLFFSYKSNLKVLSPP